MKKNITLLKWHNFCTDFILYAPFALIYYSNVSGSYTLGISIFAIAMFSSSIFEVPTGVYSDMIGRKKTIQIGSFVSLISALCMSFGSTFLVLLVGAIFSGLARAFYSGNNDALLYDTLLENNREDEFAYYLGITSSMFETALAISALIGSLVAFWSLHLAVVLSIVPQVIALILSFFITEPKVHSSKSGNVFTHFGESFRVLKENRKLTLVALASMLRYGLGESVYRFRSIFIAGLWPVWATGIAYSLSNFGGAIGLSISGKVIKKLTFIKTVVGEIIINRIINITAIFFPTVFSPILLSAASFFWGITDVGIRNELQKEFTQKQRATIGSINSLFGNILLAFFAFLFGIAADTIGPRNTLLFVQVLYVLILILYWQFEKLERKNL